MTSKPICRCCSPPSIIINAPAMPPKITCHAPNKPIAVPTFLPATDILATIALLIAVPFAKPNNILGIASMAGWAYNSGNTPIKIMASNENTAPPMVMSSSG